MIERRPEEPEGAGQARLRRQTPVREQREIREDIDLLIAASDAEARDAVGGKPRDLTILEADGAGARREVAREHVDERGLAGAVWPDDRMHLAGPKLEGDIAHRSKAIERPGKRRHPEDRLSHRRSRAPGARRRARSPRGRAAAAAP